MTFLRLKVCVNVVKIQMKMESYDYPLAFRTKVIVIFKKSVPGIGRG